LRLDNIYVFVYVDALPLRYINSHNTPFLASLMKQGYFILDNIPGYSFGIQSTMLSGKLPQETKHWMPYIYISEFCEQNDNCLSMHRNLYFPSFLNKLRYLPKPMRYIYQFNLCNPIFGIFKKNAAKLCGISIEYLDKFYIYPYYYMNENPFFLKLKNIFEEEYGVNVYYLGHSLRSIQNNLIKLLKDVYSIRAESRQDLVLFTYIDDLDSTGHVQGVGTKQWFEKLNMIDISLSYMYRLFRRLAKSVCFIVFSDHSICNTDEYIDIENLFHKYNLKNSTFYFIDATLAFIWVDNYRRKESVLKIINKKLRGKIRVFDIEADKDTLQRYGVYFRDRKYGDLIVQTKPCKEFFPNFYSITTPLKGLHGFWPDEDLQQAYIITASCNHDFDLFKLRHIKDIRNFLLNLISFP